MGQYVQGEREVQKQSVPCSKDFDRPHDRPSRDHDRNPARPGIYLSLHQIFWSLVFSVLNITINDSVCNKYQLLEE
jgi:hypothetical protein